MKSSKHRLAAVEANLQPASKPAEKPTTTISEYEWVEVKPMESIELNYLDCFVKKHTDETIDYGRLDIPRANPCPTSQSQGFDLSSIETRLSKWGGLSIVTKKDKKDKENYDFEDSFIDDKEEEVTNKHNPGYIESVLEDFVCVGGDLKAFKKSKYYTERVTSIKKSLLEENKKKKKSPMPKESSGHKDKAPEEVKEPTKKKKRENQKRKRSSMKEGIERPEKELKAKKNNEQAKGTDGSDKTENVHVQLKE